MEKVSPSLSKGHFPSFLRQAPIRMASCFCRMETFHKTAEKLVTPLKKLVQQSFKIPTRSPDLNLIENIFHGVKVKLREDALARRITRETFEEFSERCKDTLTNYPVDIINRTIESLPKRIDLVIQRRGQQTKY